MENKGHTKDSDALNAALGVNLENFADPDQFLPDNDTPEFHPSSSPESTPDLLETAPNSTPDHSEKTPDIAPITTPNTPPDFTTPDTNPDTNPDTTLDATPNFTPATPDHHAIKIDTKRGGLSDAALAATENLKADLRSGKIDPATFYDGARDLTAGVLENTFANQRHATDTWGNKLSSQTPKRRHH